MLEEKIQGLIIIEFKNKNFILTFFFLFRDFAYVAKDKDRTHNTYKCHVFRCDNTSARIIANTLRDVCRNLMIERGLLNPTTEISNDGILIQQR